jgi:hypothetical protein
MRKIALAAIVMFSLGIAAGSAEAQSRPGSCLKYGLGGAIAGHFAGGHRIKGALAGCALGIYQRRQYEREVREQNEIRNRIPERPRAPMPNGTTATTTGTEAPIGLPCLARRAPVPMRILALTLVAAPPVSRPREVKTVWVIGTLDGTVTRRVGRLREGSRRAVIVWRTGSGLPTQDGKGASSPRRPAAFLMGMAKSTDLDWYSPTT